MGGRKILGGLVVFFWAACVPERSERPGEGFIGSCEDLSSSSCIEYYNLPLTTVKMNCTWPGHEWSDRYRCDPSSTLGTCYVDFGYAEGSTITAYRPPATVAQAMALCQSMTPPGMFTSGP